MKSGFTLLELLVVMTLIGLMAGVAVPRMGTAVETVLADAEKRTLVEMTAQVKLHAFLRQQSHTLLFEEGAVKYPEGTLVKAFDYIRFPRQRIYWNTRGFPNIRTLDYTIRGQADQLALF